VLGTGESYYVLPSHPTRVRGLKQMTRNINQLAKTAHRDLSVRRFCTTKHLPPLPFLPSFFLLFPFHPLHPCYIIKISSSFC